MEIERAAQAGDYLLHVDKENCPRFGKLKGLAGKNSEYLKVVGYFYDNFRGNIEKLTNRTTSTWEDMLALCGYIEWSSYSSVELMFAPTPFDYQYCLAMGDAKLFTTSFGTAGLWQLSTVKFLEDVRAYAQKVNAGA